MPRIELERPETIEDISRTSQESFDRIAFAERALELVAPSETTIAICEGSRDVRLEAGRQWGAPSPRRWAVLSIPANASRRAIADAILTLCSGTTRPWALDVLLDSSVGIYRGPAPSPNKHDP